MWEYKNGICTDNQTRWTMLSDLFTDFPSMAGVCAGWHWIASSCTRQRRAVLRVNRKYIDHCLEEIERLWRQRGIVGFSENGRRLDTDICRVDATALRDLDVCSIHLWADIVISVEIQPDLPEPTVRRQGCVCWPEWGISFPYLRGLPSYWKAWPLHCNGSSKLTSCEKWALPWSNTSKIRVGPG